MSSACSKSKNIKILVHKFGGMGDYLCILPFLEDLRKSYPDADITIIITHSGEELIKNAACVDSIIIPKSLGGQGRSSIFSFSAISDILEIRRELKTPYDIFIDLTSKYSRAGSFKPWLINYLSKPKLSIGLDFMNRGGFLDIKVPEDRYEPKHNIIRYNEVLTALLQQDADFKDYKKTFDFHLADIKIPSGVQQKADVFYADFHDKPTNIGFHPGANPSFLKHRAWPAERFAELADMCHEQFNCELFVSGSDNEEDIIRTMLGLTHSKINRIPVADSVVELAAYLAKLDFYITNDTGPMHLAVAMKVPTVGIFGHADFESYGSYPPDVPFSAITFDKGEKHGPSPSEDDPRCLKMISVEDVFSALKELMKQ